MAFEKTLTLEQIRDSDNIAKLLSDKDLEEIGSRVVESFDIDKQSRRKWEKNNEAAMELALQIKQPKVTPWRGAANVKFPLLTIASLQFASRAYPALVKAPDLVKYRVQGSDEDGQKAARAQRISAHMSYQLLDQDESWEEDQDKALLILPILGCIFKKSYYDPIKGHNRSTLVLPKNLVVHYYAKSIEDAERKTEIFELYKRGIKERELRGVFKEHDYGTVPIANERGEDKRQGLSAPLDDKDRPRVFLEQHCYLDLDGDDYKEPYVVTVDKETRKVARIVARIDEVETEQSVAIEELQKRIKALAEGVQQPQDPEDPTPEELAQIQQTEQILIGMQDEVKRLTEEKPKVLSITAVEHYTKYGFIPSTDGGFYDIGFGLLLGDLSESVNTLINQLIDAGSRANSSSGFLGKGARIKGGRLTFAIGEWKRVPVAGSTLRDSIVPLPASEPSDVLLKLLSLLINYTERVGSVNDAMMGENPGQNTPAFTSKQMLEQGLQVFNGIFKRIYRSFRAETRKLFKLNALYLDQEEYFSYQDSDICVLKTDYTGDAKDLIPAADPNAFSNTEKAMKAQAVAERAKTVSGYDLMVVEMGLLESMDIPNSAELYPRVPGRDEEGNETGEMVLKFPPQPDPELEIEKADMQRRTLEGEARAEKDMILAQSSIKVDQANIIRLMMDAEVAEDNAEYKMLELLLKEQEILSKNLVELAKIEASKEIKRVASKK